MLNELLYVVCFSIVGLLEKYSVTKHTYTNFTLARTIYMLLFTFAFMVFITKAKVTSIRQTLKDPVILVIGALTAIGILLYFKMLKTTPLYMLIMLWPIVMIAMTVGAVVFFKERISVIQMFGIALTYIGLAITFLCNPKVTI